MEHAAVLQERDEVRPPTAAERTPPPQLTVAEFPSKTALFPTTTLLPESTMKNTPPTCKV